MIRARTPTAKTGRPFSLSMRGRYRLADLCEFYEIDQAAVNQLRKLLLYWPHAKKATVAGNHVLVNGENFLWALNQLPQATDGGPQR